MDDAFRWDAHQFYARESPMRVEWLHAAISIAYLFVWLMIVTVTLRTSAARDR
jgi:hypothetical protein